MRRSMSNEHKESLRRNHVRLVDEMQSEYLLNHFIQEGVFLPDMVEDIRAKQTAHSMNEQLLRLLPMRGDRAFDVLIQALRYGSEQPHLADLLLQPVLPLQSQESDLVHQQPSQDNLHVWMELKEHTASVAPAESAMSYHLSSSSDLKTQMHSTSETTQVRKSSIEGELQCPRQELQPSTPSKAANEHPHNHDHRRKTSLQRSNHMEILPDVIHLFPYVVPHIHNKWRQLATHLGLTQADVDHIHEIPHGKSSHYATLVLNAWTEKFKLKATKIRLQDALKRTSVRKALDAIAIYDVPKATTRRKNFIQNRGRSAAAQKLHRKNDFITSSSSTLSGEAANGDTWGQHRVALPKLGELHVHCDVMNVELNTLSQRVFLDMAPKITEAMLRSGEAAKEVLNGLKELKGILCNGLHHGSVVVEFQVFTLMALERLRLMYHNGYLRSVLERLLVTDSILTEFDALSIKLSLHIETADFERCQAELRALQAGLPLRPTMAQGSCSNMSTSEEDDPEEDNVDDDGWHQLVETMSSQFAQIVLTLQEELKAFESYTSEFLLSLQLLHPFGITRIRSIVNLEQFYIMSQQQQKSNAAAESHSLARFLSMYRMFVSSAQSFKNKFTLVHSSDVHSAGHVQACYQGALDMLVDTYDFSALQHPCTAKLTTQEAIGYRGLMSYPYVLLDKLAEVQIALHQLSTL